MQIQTCLLDADSTHSHDTVRYVWEGEQVRVTADITSTDLLRIEVKAHQVQPSSHASITNYFQGKSI
jgi:hypothetical protein